MFDLLDYIGVCLPIPLLNIILYTQCKLKEHFYNTLNKILPTILKNYL